MRNIKFDIQKIIQDFLRVAELSNINLLPTDIEVEMLPAPHKPSNLPFKKMAVYAFFDNGICLKVGKAGSNSGPRYVSQHYNPKSAQSNLAKSLLIDGYPVEESKIGDWIKENICRINFLLKSDKGIEVLNLLEAFLQCVFKPKYEGFKSQKII